LNQIVQAAGVAPAAADAEASPVTGQSTDATVEPTGEAETAVEPTAILAEPTVAPAEPTAPSAEPTVAAEETPAG